MHLTELYAKGTNEEHASHHKRFFPISNRSRMLCSMHMMRNSSIAISSPRICSLTNATRYCLATLELPLRRKVHAIKALRMLLAQQPTWLQSKFRASHAGAAINTLWVLWFMNGSQVNVLFMEHSLRLQHN